MAPNFRPLLAYTAGTGGLTKKLIAAVVLLSSTAFAQISDDVAKSLSFEGHVTIVMEASQLVLWNDHLTLQTDANEVADLSQFLKSKGAQVMSGVCGNEKTGLMIASVKLNSKNDEISVMVMNTKAGNIYFYNISSAAEGLITSKDDRYSDLLVQITKD